MRPSVAPPPSLTGRPGVGEIVDGLLAMAASVPGDRGPGSGYPVRAGQVDAGGRTHCPSRRREDADFVQQKWRAQRGLP